VEGRRRRRPDGGAWRRMAGENAIGRSRPRFGLRLARGERERNMGSRSRGFGDSHIGHGGQAMAGGGSGAPTSSRGRRESRQREKRAGDHPYPTGMPPRCLCDGKERRDDGAVVARGGGGGGVLGS
jgi:hypothetical protein